MSKESRNDGRITLEERYNMLRRSLAHYLLLQVNTFIAGAGLQAVAPAMEILTQKSSEIRARKIEKDGNIDPAKAMVALSENLAESMGETFRSDYSVSEGESSRTVTLRECGCIRSITDIASEYGLSAPQARSIFCGACMNSYRKTAQTLKLGFEGRLSKGGCFMSFSTK